MKDQDNHHPLKAEVRPFAKRRAELYRITVSGLIDPKWSDRLGGLHIEPETGSQLKNTATVLEGQVQDQAQLSGILNALYDMHCTLLSVELLNKTDDLRHT